MGNIKIIKGVFDTKLELEHAEVAAGFPINIDYSHETLDFNRDYIKHPEASFYGDVEGDSMIDAGIFDGDRVIIDRAVQPHDGSIVVAWWGGEGPIKTRAISNCVLRTMSTRYSRLTPLSISRFGE